MCLIDDVEPCIWFGTDMRKATKIHRCEECGREIAVGESYAYSRFVMGGNFCDNRACLHCHIARSWLTVHCGGWVTNALREELHDHWSHGYREDRLGRLLIGVKRKWRRRDGTLMPLPPVVEVKVAA